VTAYRDFVDQLLVQLYKENEGAPGQYTRFNDAARSAGLSPRRDWVLRFTEEVEGNGYAQVSKHLGNPADWHVRIKARGLEYVEEVLGVVERSTGGDVPVDSSSWTGLPANFQLSETKRASIVRALDLLEDELPTSTASQHDQAQARAYVIAARALLEAPDPEPELAWQLIGRANNLAGIASLLVSIIGLFT